MKKEWNLLNFVNMQSLFLGIGFSKILISSKENFLFSILIGYILGMILLYFLDIKKKNNIFNIILYSIISIYALVILINMASTMYLNLMSKSTISIPLLLLMLYVLNKKEIILYRVNNIILIINICLYLFALFCLLPYFDISNFVYSNTKSINILTSGLNYTILSTSIVLMTKENQKKDKSILKTYTMATIFLIIVCVMIYGIFSYPLVESIRYPEYVLLKKISIGGFIQNIENFLSSIWLFNIIMSLLYLTNNIKNCLNNKKIINFIVPVLFIIASIVNKYYVAMLTMYKYEPFILGITALIFIILNYNYKKKSHE